MLMRRSLLALALLIGMAVAGEPTELFKNPRFENKGQGWENWGKRSDLQILEGVGGGVCLRAETPGLHQGLAQSVQLVRGRKYRYSCTFSAKCGEGGKVGVLSVYVAGSKWNKTLRMVVGQQDEDTHVLEFSVPEDLESDKILFRPVILWGACDVLLKEASLKEIGAGDAVKKQVAHSLPVIVPVVHPMGTLDLSQEKPCNVRAHEDGAVAKVLPEGASVEHKDGAFIINYNFTTDKHDAIMFDINKEIVSAAKVSMDLECSAEGHRLFFVLVDAGGESHWCYKPLNLDFVGRKTLTYTLALPKEEPYNVLDSIWGGDKNQHLDLPLKSITIGIDDVPDTATGKGTVIIYNLKIGNWK